MPSWELFEQQDQAYRDGVLPPDVTGPRLRGDGFGDRLGPLCRRDRRQDRHARLRLFGSAQGPARRNSGLRPRPSSQQRRNRLQSQEGRRRDDRAGQNQGYLEPLPRSCATMGKPYGSTSSPGASSPRAVSRTSSTTMDLPELHPIPPSSKSPSPAAPITMRR